MRRVYTLLFIVCALALVALFVLPNPFRYLTAKSFSASGLKYDSRAGSSIYEHFEGAANGLKEFSVSLRFKPNSVARHPNLFQTAPLNDGVRVELSKPRIVVAIIGSQNTSRFVPVMITSAVTLNQWHTLDIKVDSNNQVTANYDGIHVVQSDPTITYRIADLAIGTGFSKKRNFDGQISDAAVSYRFLKLNPNGDGYNLGLRTVVFIAAMVFLFLMSARNQKVTTEPAAD